MSEDDQKNETRSIINSKYGKGYKGAQDWLSNFISEQCTVPVMKKVTETEEDGTKVEKEVESAKRKTDLHALFALAEKNHIKATELYGDQMDQPNAPGRLRMTIGNRLRAAARKRHGLYDLDGEWADAPADFLDGAELKEHPDGTKIEKSKGDDAKAA